jgi:hypothetical protein
MTRAGRFVARRLAELVVVAVVAIVTALAICAVAPVPAYDPPAAPAIRSR